MEQTGNIGTDNYAGSPVAGPETSSRNMEQAFLRKAKENGK